MVWQMLNLASLAKAAGMRSRPYLPPGLDLPRFEGSLPLKSSLYINAALPAAYTIGCTCVPHGTELVAI